MEAEHDSDQSMLARIAAAFDRDLPPIPPHLSAAARDAIHWRRADAVLAELTFDSATDELVGVRGTGTERRSFRYAAGEAVIRIHLTDATMVVIVEPPLEVVCRVATSGGKPVEHRTDDDGELVIDAPDLPVRVEVDLPDGTVVTPWITA